ncbi:MAG TPA: dockerin type I domain-containing protein, partial [Tepidisphaeraceae bacterium]
YANSTTAGALYRVANPNSASPTWTAITPSAGAYSAIAIDPATPTTIYTAVFDRYPDNIYRSTNSGTTWSPVGGLNPVSHLDNSSAFYANSQSTHWLTDLEIDPFNNNAAMFNTGYGIFRTTNLTAATPTWSFYDDGLEETAALELVSPASGSVHLLDAIGDRDGFRHDNLSSSPSIGTLGQSNGLNKGSSDDIDVAANDPNQVVRVLRSSPYVQYSVNGGVNWSWFPIGGATGDGADDGNVAISADGTRAVFEPSGSGTVLYSTRSGSTWSAWTAPTTGTPGNTAKLVADLVNPQTFYAYSNTTVSRSTDGGVNWTVMTGSAPSVSNDFHTDWVRAVPGQAGHLLVSRRSGGLSRSTDGGATWTQLSVGVVTTANQVGVGAAATPGGYPAIYVGGTVSGQNGFFRSDDQGATWTMISDLSHNYGYVTVIQGDPQVYGRLYIGTNGRGIVYGDIHQSLTTLPAGWSTQDIGSPGSAGSAGESGGTFEVIGGGSGAVVGGASSDQFRFAYQTLNGDGAITARVMGVPDASPANNRASAGVMIRQSLANNSAAAFVALTPGSVNGVQFATRATTGGASTTPASATLGIWPPYWVRLVRAGDQFTAFISPDGTNWAQLGTPQTISMSGPVFIGLAVTAADNNQLNISTFQNVSLATADTTAPSVTASDFLFMHSPNKLTFTFSEDVSASLGIDDLLVSLVGGGNITPTDFQYSPGTNVATFTLPVNLANGNYTATLLHSGITDAALNTMSADYTKPFFVLAGDANRDRVVNSTDLGILSVNWNQSPRDWTQGDFNDDGVVNVDDLDILSRNWQQSVAELPTLSPAPLPPDVTPVKKPVARRAIAQITEL